MFDLGNSHHSTYIYVMTKQIAIGYRSGLLTAVREIKRLNERTGYQHTWWVCRCECGNEKEVIPSHLRREGVKSCGCQTNAWKARNATKHGLYGTPAYKTWIEINRRCFNPKFKKWANYGGRGITVCERWRTFENFLADMGERPFPKAEIDRIDSNGHYEPGNCRWTDRATQMRNVSTNRYVTANGRTMILSDWSRETGLDTSIICTRIKNGWTEEDAVTRGTDHRRYLTASGRTMCLTDWAKETGLSPACIRRRLRLGWSEADAVLTPQLK